MLSSLSLPRTRRTTTRPRKPLAPNPARPSRFVADRTERNPVGGLEADHGRRQRVTCPVAVAAPKAARRLGGKAVGRFERTHLPGPVIAYLFDLDRPNHPFGMEDDVSGSEAVRVEGLRKPMRNDRSNRNPASPRPARSTRSGAGLNRCRVTKNRVRAPVHIQRFIWPPPMLGLPDRRHERVTNF